MSRCPVGRVLLTVSRVQAAAGAGLTRPGGGSVLLVRVLRADCGAWRPERTDGGAQVPPGRSRGAPRAWLRRGFALISSPSCRGDHTAASDTVPGGPPTLGRRAGSSCSGTSLLGGRRPSLGGAEGSSRGEGPAALRGGSTPFIGNTGKGKVGRPLWSQGRALPGPQTGLRGGRRGP